MKTTKIEIWVWTLIFRNRKLGDLVCDINHYMKNHKALIDIQCHSYAVCTDPMNGCPGDFAEDFSRKQYRIEREIDTYPYAIPKPIRKILDFKLMLYQHKSLTQLRQLPRLN